MAPRNAVTFTSQELRLLGGPGLGEAYEHFMEGDRQSTSYGAAADAILAFVGDRQSSDSVALRALAAKLRALDV